MDALGKGYAVAEIHWQRDKTRWTPARYDYRDPRFFQFGPTIRTCAAASPCVVTMPNLMSCHQLTPKTRHRSGPITWARQRGR